VNPSSEAQERLVVSDYLTKVVAPSCPVGCSPRARPACVRGALLTYALDRLEAEGKGRKR
jgi:hypothetical protein